MHPYSFLKAKVEAAALPAGFQLSSEELHPDVFGSYFCIFQRGDEHLRLVWDGKDGVGFLESRVGDESEWSPLGRVLGEGEIESSPQNVEAIAAWESELRQAVA
jgi:hypothetical protein